MDLATMRRKGAAVQRFGFTKGLEDVLDDDQAHIAGLRWLGSDRRRHCLSFRHYQLSIRAWALKRRMAGRSIVGMSGHLTHINPL